MHPDFDEVMSSASVDYRTRCQTDASFASKFRIPPVVEPSHSFREHTNSVDAVCWGPDAGTFVSASHDSTLKVWDCRRGQCMETLSGHVAGVYHCAVAGNRQLVISCGSGEERNVLLWRWPEKKVCSVLKGHGRSAIHACFSSDSCLAATTGQDGTLLIHDVGQGACRLQKSLHVGTCHGSAFCREDPNLLVTGGSDGYLQLLDLRQEAYPKAWQLPSAVANSVVYNPNLSIPGAHDGYAIYAVEFTDRNTIYSGGADHKLKRWDIRAMAPFKPRALNQYLGHTAPVRSLTVSPDQRLTGTGCEDGSLRIWPRDPLGDAKSLLRTLRMQAKDTEDDIHDIDKSVSERQALSRQLDELKASIAGHKANEERLSREGYVPALRTLNGHVALVSGCSWQEDAQQKVANILSSSWDQSVQLFNISLDGLA
jgi:WD40 repeat protein